MPEMINTALTVLASAAVTFGVCSLVWWIVTRERQSRPGHR
jgi:hypothetical protein